MSAFIKDHHVREPAEGGVIGEGGKGKVDGLAKITGDAIYTDDIVLPKMVFAKVLRSPHAHARILDIDASEALAMDGVLAVMTGQDVPIKYGAIPVAQDETALAIDKVRYIGEPVVCVAATTEELAYDACRRIRVLYEPLQSVLSIDEALDPEREIIHDKARKPSNVLRHVKQDYGDIDAAFADSDLVFEADYDYPGSTHVPLETQAAVASYGADGRLTLWSSTQNPHYMHRTIAKVLEMRQSDVRVIKPEVGAGYGGKCDTFCTDVCTAWLSRKLQRPVKFIFEREEVFYAHRGRHRTKMRLKMGMNKDGSITGIDFQAWAEGGAYASYGVVTSFYLGVFMTMPYRLENYRFESHRVYTNHPPCGPKRGHGAIQPRFALELHIDRMARQLGLDPVNVRRQNLVEAGHETINGLKVPSIALDECIERVMAASGYREKLGKLGPGRGIGLAASAYMCGALHAVYPNELPHSGVQLKVDRSGRVTIFSGTADVGQGSNHMLAVFVAERLGIAPTDCKVIEADTDLTPVDLGSYSSRVTFMAGNAALAAADAVRAQIVEAVAAKFRIEPEVLTLRDGAVHGAYRPVPWVEAVTIAEEMHGTIGSTGSYRPPKIGSRLKRTSVGPSPAYSFTAQVAEVTVDEETGIVTVDKMWAAHDLGRVLHKEIAEGQIEGCVYMGVGEALLEEQKYRRNGVHMTPSLLEYRVPTVYDTPEIEVIMVESHDPGGPFGAKEAGEGPQLSTVPAIGNALFDALGVWLPAPPYTPDKVLKALRSRR
jgi:4-hydroxybenzoyl-CoA reductase subunit alpha